MVYTIVVHLYAKDSTESISRLYNKLLEASDVYSRDKETISWFVMQDHQDKRAFTIVERYEYESVRRFLSLSRMLSTTLKPTARKCIDELPDIEPEISSRGNSKASTSRSMIQIVDKRFPGSNPTTQNPYWKTFNPYVEPLLEKPMDLRRFNELDEKK